MAALQVLPPRAQSGCISPPFNTWDLPDGSNRVSFHRTLSGFLVRFPGLADFELSTDGDRVTCSPAPNVSRTTTEHLYINQVLPLVLSKSGKLVFHGSAVELGTDCIAFLAASGRGKSTLAASLAINGHRFLTDDGLLLDQVDGAYRVIPESSFTAAMAGQSTRDFCETSQKWRRNCLPPRKPGFSPRQDSRIAMSPGRCAPPIFWGMAARLKLLSGGLLRSRRCWHGLDTPFYSIWKKGLLLLATSTEPQHLLIISFAMNWIIRGAMMIWTTSKKP